jgi:hypothetical protein
MTSEQIRQHITTVPFIPFHVRTADDRRVLVLNRDFILITPTQHHLFIFQPDDSYQVLDVDLIVGVEFSPPLPQVPVPNLNT